MLLISVRQQKVIRAQIDIFICRLVQMYGYGK